MPDNAQVVMSLQGSPMPVSPYETAGGVHRIARTAVPSADVTQLGLACEHPQTDLVYCLVYCQLDVHEKGAFVECSS